MAPEKEIKPGIFVTPADAIHRGITASSSLETAWVEIGLSMGYLKPDGWRFQVHSQKGKTNLFSREGKDWSDRFPTVVKTLSAALGPLPIVLDTEVVGYDDNDRHVSPARILSASKYVCILLDGLILNDEIITENPVEERIEKVKNTINKNLDTSLKIASYRSLDSKEELESLYQTFIRERALGYDGIILKKKGTGYFSRAFKLKSEITVDPVILGGYWTKDKKLTALLLAVFDHQTNMWIPVGKVADIGQNWEDTCKACLEQIIENGPINIIRPPAPPNFWINPSVVVQVTARSVSKGARGSYIIRIDAPRDVILRRDKGVANADTFDQLLEIADISERPPISGSLF